MRGRGDASRWHAGKRGLPLSLQLVGRPFSEALLLAAGRAYQRETDWHSRVPA